jgi:hypothetical protein
VLGKECFCKCNEKMEYLDDLDEEIGSNTRDATEDARRGTSICSIGCK